MIEKSKIGSFPRIQFNGVQLHLAKFLGFHDRRFVSRDPDYSGEDLALHLDTNRNPLFLMNKNDLQDFSFVYSTIHVISEHMIDQNGFTIGAQPNSKWIGENCTALGESQICNVSYIRPRTGQRAYYKIDKEGRIKNITVQFQ